MPHVISTFSNPVYVGDVTVPAGVTDYCSTLPTLGDYFEEFRTSVDDQVLENAALEEMRNQILDHINVFNGDVMGIDLNKFQFTVTTSWYSYMTDKSYVAAHRHVNSLFTGFVTLTCSLGTIFTVNVPNPPAIPSTFALAYAKETPYNTLTHNFTLKPQQIVIFPSHVGHRAECKQPGGRLDLIIFDVFLARVRGRPPVGTGTY